MKEILQFPIYKEFSVASSESDTKIDEPVNKKQRRPS